MELPEQSQSWTAEIITWASVFIEYANCSLDEALDQPLSMLKHYEKSLAFENAKRLKKAEYEKFNILIKSIGGVAETVKVNFGSLFKSLSRRK